jgi:hypothetical protein
MANRIGIDRPVESRDNLALFPYFNFQGINEKVVNMKCKVEWCTNVVENKRLMLCGKHAKHIHRHGKILERTPYDPNEFVIDGETCIIRIFDRYGDIKAETIIDSEDYNKVKDYKWHVSAGAIKTDIDRKKLNLSNLILGIINSRQIVIDHIDRNKLNNRKSNLRLATHRQNDCNKIVRKDSVSGYKGVQLHKQTGKWRARIKVDYKNIHLGLFEDILDAAKAYNEAALRYYGEFAYLNDVD